MSNLPLPGYSTPRSSSTPEQTSQVKVLEKRQEQSRRNIPSRRGERKIFVRQCTPMKNCARGACTFSVRPPKCPMHLRRCSKISTAMSSSCTKGNLHRLPGEENRAHWAGGRAHQSPQTRSVDKRMAGQGLPTCNTALVGCVTSPVY
jgi:hypothetical protein